MVKLIGYRKSFITFLIWRACSDKLESEVQVVLAMLIYRQHARQFKVHLPATEMVFLLRKEENTASDNRKLEIESILYMIIHHCLLKIHITSNVL